MPHISSKKISQEMSNRIMHRLYGTFVSLTTVSRAADFTTDFFSQTERLMFAKRLTAVFMISEGVSSYRISKILSMSHSSILRLERIIDRGGFASLVVTMQKPKVREMFWDDIERLARLGLPRRGSGKERWDWLRKYH